MCRIKVITPKSGARAVATQLRYLQSSAWLKEGSIGDVLTTSLIERIERAEENGHNLILKIPTDEAVVSAMVIQNAINQVNSVFVGHYKLSAKVLINNIEQAFKNQLPPDEAISLFEQVDYFKQFPRKIDINQL